MIKYLEIVEGEYIRVWPFDIRKVVKHDYIGAGHKWQIHIFYKEGHGVYHYKTKEKRDSKFDELLSMLGVEENAHE